MDPVDRPPTVVDEVIDNVSQELEGRCRIRMLDHFTQVIEGCVPLVGLLVEKRDPEIIRFSQSR